MYHYAEDHEIDLIEREVAELFAEFDCGLYISMGQAELASEVNNFAAYEKYDRQQISSIPEVLCAWYADEKKQYKNIDNFLEINKLSDFLSEKDFISVINRRSLLPMYFLPLLKEKLSFNIGVNKLAELNRRHYMDNRWLKPLKMDEIKIVAELKQIRTAKKQQRIAELKKWRKTYEQEHAEKIKAYKQQYFQEHKQEITERTRLFYEANPEKRKEILKKYRLKHTAEIAEIKKRYYEKHKAELLEKAKTWRENNPEKVQETSRRNYAQNRDKRREQNKEWIKNNPEARQRQKARYYAAHAAEIAAKEARRRNKKRFQTKTGTKILGLLQGIIQARL